MIRVGKQSAARQSTFEKQKDDWVLGTRTISEMILSQAYKVLVREMNRKGTYIRIKPNQISLCRQRPINRQPNRTIWFVFEGKKEEMRKLVLAAEKATASRIGCVHAGAEGIDNFPPKTKGWKLYGGGYGISSKLPTHTFPDFESLHDTWVNHPGDIVQ